MLKTDYKGFGEFMEKIKTAGEEETRTLCGIRQQMWLQKYGANQLRITKVLCKLKRQHRILEK